ncbi:MAG: hypothetical protein AAF439_15600 [Pseudomonadota bacterium]
MTLSVQRVGNAPIIHAGMCASLGDNINGPSLIRRPAWAPGPGRYLLYFAHHMGQHIRLAVADDPQGPWQVHAPGVLPLADTPLVQVPPDVPQPDWAVAMGVDGLYPHLASPEVWVDEQARCFRMWFHGMADDGVQVSYRASSSDGLTWTVHGPPIPQTYLRRFTYRDQAFGMGHGGQLLRITEDKAQLGPYLFSRSIRHVGVLAEGDRLNVLYTCIGDAPERIFHQALDLGPGWPYWHPTGPETEMLRPEATWEGAELPVEPSLIGATDFTHALRDPVLFRDEGRIWMIYAGGGEAALGLARIDGLD